MEKKIYLYKLFSEFHFFALALLILCIIVEDLSCSSLKDIFVLGVCLYFKLKSLIRSETWTFYPVFARNWPCGSGGDEIWTLRRYNEAIPLPWYKPIFFYQSSGSDKVDFCKRLYFHYFVIMSPRKGMWFFIWPKLNSFF